MPELIEAAAYARTAGRAVGATIVEVMLADPSWVRGGLSGDDLASALVGTEVVEVGRLGKVVLLGTDGPTVALRFGMTGRLLWDDDAPIDELVYGPKRSEEAWVRFALSLQHPGEEVAHRLAVEDARRLGSVELDADLSDLGPDAVGIHAEQLADAFGTTTTPLKAALLDQRRLAGLGNLLADEVLWRAGMHPETPAGTLKDDELVLLADTIALVVAELSKRGGSHTGDLQPQRAPDGVCPRDGAPLVRGRVGGRTTWWCSLHQRRPRWGASPV